MQPSPLAVIRYLLSFDKQNPVVKSPEFTLASSLNYDLFEKPAMSQILTYLSVLEVIRAVPLLSNLILQIIML